MVQTFSYDGNHTPCTNDIVEGCFDNIHKVVVKPLYQCTPHFKGQQIMNKFTML